MWRKSFVLGCVCGALACAGILALAGWCQPGTQPPRGGRTIVPVTPCSYPPSVPPNWQRREFNGVPYYDVPLSSAPIGSRA